MTTSCFSFTPLNKSTYKVVQDDSLNELPFIYVKVYPTLLVLIDTGCGPNHAKDPTVEEKSIRRYIETNLDKEGKLKYVDPETSETKNKHWLVFITHTHYDHIGGLFEFADDSSIFISGYSQEYILKDLGCNSLCCAFNIPTPKFTVSHWLEQNEHVKFNGVDLHLEALITPGHTPDEIALYDSEEHVFYAGDSLYEVLPIYIIETSNMIEYVASIDMMLKYVQAKNKELEPLGVRVTTASGHITDSADTENLIIETQECFWDTLKGKAILTEQKVMREKNIIIYMNEANNVGFMCIDTKLEEAKKHFGFEWELPAPVSA
ncbi:beta-lactamase-like protein [Lipomyces chichibuensis]|uniref:beta-lactamase-like protein n=1 Tax=Lipomyces chichibuensis TaxID=1546026 RepID=UPI0033440FB2